MVPCLKRLDADCFRAHPAWARQAFAYRLVHLLTPKQLTRRLPKLLRAALLAPGVVLPPGLVLPAGTLVAPGTELPSVWSPGDPVPQGVTVEPGASFPPGWTPADPAPEGVTLEPGASFPPDWNPPDPVPEGMIPTPALPPAAVATGPTPPTYVAPATSEPTSQPGRAGAPAEPETVTLPSNANDGYIWNQDSSWATARDGDTGYDPVDSDTAYSSALRCAFYNATYYCRRIFLPFDLSSIPSGSTIISATVCVIGYYRANTQISIQQAAPHWPLVKEDFQTMSGDYFKKLTWDYLQAPNLNTNEFELNAAGIAYVEGKIGNTASFCLREYEHDYLDVPPPDNTSNNGSFFFDHTTETLRPYITVVYE